MKGPVVRESRDGRTGKPGIALNTNRVVGSNPTLPFRFASARLKENATKFNPRDIPNRAHYDRLMTWVAGVFGRQDGDALAEFQKEITARATKAANGTDDEEKIIAVLAELGFCAVIDHMADIIESEGV